MAKKKKNNAKKKHQQKMAAKASAQNYVKTDVAPTETPKSVKKDPEPKKQEPKKAAVKQVQKQKAAKKKQRRTFRDYLRGVKLEMRKVVWPTREEMSSYTLIVLATCAAFALLFWGVDSGVLAGIKEICF